ncbi:MAG: helix-turn-helix transcriptional regulator [Clostridia bacterium]|nr:helix-turn-helix transcriptional regulator [Clostridia bacterium]MBQ7339181.1 helix-turn-helix transcriptional regulator [Clostridia bacterium]
MNIGNNIKALRTQAGLTQEQLAEHLGVTYQAISKWETGANTPDISLLPGIAAVFGTSIDALFAKEPALPPITFDDIPDDDTFRIIQLRGRKPVKVDRTFSPDCPPIEIAFPRNCNDQTQYFKVEVQGHLIADGSINGDVICHKSIQCADVNGMVRCEGDISAHVVNTHADIHCAAIKDCYRITCRDIRCGGDVHAASIHTGQMGNEEIPTLK